MKYKIQIQTPSKYHNIISSENIQIRGAPTETSLPATPLHSPLHSPQPHKWPSTSTSPSSSPHPHPPLCIQDLTRVHLNTYILRQSRPRRLHSSLFEQHNTTSIYPPTPSTSPTLACNCRPFRSYLCCSRAFAPRMLNPAVRFYSI